MIMCFDAKTMLKDMSQQEFSIFLQISGIVDFTL